MKTYKMKINGQKYEAKIVKYDGSLATINVNGNEFEIEIAADKKAAAPKLVRAEKVASTPHISTPKPAAAPSQASSGGASSTVNAPIPGIVIDVKVNVGDNVNAGDTVVILEAMKMESEINADHAGTVKAIKVSKGDSVTEDQVLIELGE